MAWSRGRTKYTLRKDALEDLEEDFNPEHKYSSSTLEAYADKLLREDTKARPEEPKILFQEHIETRWSREVHSETGVADQTLTNAQTPDGAPSYNRTHPQGRKVNSEKQRKNSGASYYR